MDKNTQVKTVAYVRVSTLLGQNCENQLVPIRELASQRNFNLIDQYEDAGISGSREKRPALDRLLKDAKSGKFQIIICYSVDRLGRNVKHLLNLLSELDSINVRVIFIRESLDFSTPAGRLCLTMLGAVAELERNLISERIRVALAIKKRAAQVSGSGWRSGRPSISKEIKEEILRLRAEGLSIRDISKKLGLKVSKSSVSKVLNEEPSTNDNG